jgi:hypothetical protein
LEYRKRLVSVQIAKTEGQKCDHSGNGAIFPYQNGSVEGPFIFFSVGLSNEILSTLQRF